MRRGILLGALAVVLACASPAAALTPNDPTWTFDWAWPMRQVNMPAAWDITTGDPNVIIAIIDTGVDPRVPDIQGALVSGWNFVGNNGDTMDRQGHGTAIAAEIAARGNNGEGIAGYCWRCRVMPIEVNDSGTAFDPTLTAEGIRWAVDHGARIISISFNDEGTTASGDPQIASAIAYAAQHNVFVAAGAGNTGLSGFTYPAADQGSYPIAGTTQADTLYSWSTFGSWIHVAAPGCQLTLFVDSNYGPVCGNSMSAPAIAGIAGLMLSVSPTLTPGQIESALESTAKPVTGIVNGRVDAFRALQAVGGRVPTPPAPPPPPPPPAAQKNMKSVGPKMKTRVRRGLLRRHGKVVVRVRTGRVAAVFQSPKAKSCTMSLRSTDTVWQATRRKGLLSVSARVGAGRYTFDMWCRVARPSRYSLSVRALFAS